jgi:hypothetical protein
MTAEDNVLRHVKDLCLRISLKWPKPKDAMEEILNSEEIRELREATARLPEGVRPMRTDPISLLAWANSFAGNTAKRSLRG